MEVDIRKYDMLKVPLDACKENHKLLTLEVSFCLNAVAIQPKDPSTLWPNSEDWFYTGF